MLRPQCSANGRVGVGVQLGLQSIKRLVDDTLNWFVEDCRKRRDKAQPYRLRRLSAVCAEQVSSGRGYIALKNHSPSRDAPHRWTKRFRTLYFLIAIAEYLTMEWMVREGKSILAEAVWRKRRRSALPCIKVLVTESLPWKMARLATLRRAERSASAFVGHREYSPESDDLHLTLGAVLVGADCRID